MNFILGYIMNTSTLDNWLDYYLWFFPRMNEKGIDIVFSTSKYKFLESTSDICIRSNKHIDLVEF